MPAADPNFWTGNATITSTSYTGASAPSLLAPLIGAGCWSFWNPSGTIDLIVSFDGTNDAITVAAGSAYTPPSSAAPGKCWVRLSSAGSVVITGNLTARRAGAY